MADEITPESQAWLDRNVPHMRKMLELITDERMRQVAKEGFSNIHDDERNTNGELARAAACFAYAAAMDPPSRERLKLDNTSSAVVNTMWPFFWDQRAWFKVKTRKQDLVRAGALILAELERLERLSITD